MLLMGRGKILDVDIALSACVNGLPALEEDIVINHTRGHHTPKEFRIIDFSLLDHEDRFLHGALREFFGDRRRVLKRQSFNVGLRVARIVNLFELYEVRAISLDAGLGKPFDSLREGDFILKGEGGTFV